MITEFSINVDKSHGYPTIFVRGEIDIYTCAQLREMFANLLEEYSSKFILNLDEVEYIDSTGLGTIAHAARKLEENSGQIYVICKKLQIKKIFEVSGLLTKNIRLFEDENVLKKTEEVT